MSSEEIRRIITLLEQVSLQEIKAYHGSSNNHAPFDVKHKGNNSMVFFGAFTSTRHGTFFTNNPKFAALYGDVQEYDLEITNTLDLDKNTNPVFNFIDELDPHGKDRNLWWDAKNIFERGQMWELFEEEVGKRLIRYLTKKGYDSASFTETNNDDDENEIESKTIVVFNPSKIVPKNGQRELDLY